jgi:hypothetical protein
MAGHWDQAEASTSDGPNFVLVDERDTLPVDEEQEQEKEKGKGKEEKEEEEEEYKAGPAEW